MVDEAEQIVFNVSERRIRHDLVPMQQIMGDVVDRIDYLARHRGEVLGVPTGFKLLDKILGGLPESDLVVLKQRPAPARPAWLSTWQPAQTKRSASAWPFSAWRCRPNSWCSVCSPQDRH